MSRRPTPDGLLAGRHRRVRLRLWRRGHGHAHAGGRGRDRGPGTAGPSSCRTRPRASRRRKPTDQADDTDHAQAHDTDDAEADHRPTTSSRPAATAPAARRTRSCRPPASIARVRVTSLPSCRRSSTRCRTTRRSPSPRAPSTASRARSSIEQPQRHHHRRQRCDVLRDASIGRNRQPAHPQPVRLQQHVEPADREHDHPRRAPRTAARTTTAYVAELEAQHGINIFGGERIEIRNMRSPTSTATSSTSGAARTRCSASRRTSGSTTTTSVATDGRASRSRTGSTSSSSATTSATLAGRRSTSSRPARPGASATCGSATTRSGPARLLFVAGHGAGDVSDIYIQDNVLTGKNMGVDFVAPGPASAAEHRRHRQRERHGSRQRPRRGAALRRLRLRRRAQQPPADAGRPRHVHGRLSCARARSRSRTTTSPNGVGQLIVPRRTADGCGTSRRSTPPIRRRRMFEGQNLKIDVGGIGGAGMIPCPTTTQLRRLLHRRTPRRRSPRRAAAHSQNARCCRATCSSTSRSAAAPTTSRSPWIEPTADISDRRFHFDVDDRRPPRVELRRQPQRPAARTRSSGAPTMSPIGDGVLDIDFSPGGTGANGPILSFIEIERD